MISKRRQKELSALQLKKYRTEYGQYLAEGEKIVEELLLSGQKIDTILATSDWFDLHRDAAMKCNEIIEATEEELKKVSSLKTPNQVLAVVKIPESDFELKELKGKLALVLDGVQDPGNLGTIIRLCDWFSIKNIICSDSTVEVYNPKVVQASMGSIFRVSVHYTGLSHWLKEYSSKMGQPVYGAYLEGNNIYKENLSGNGLIVLGNESKGISEEVSQFISERIFIPRFANAGAESLNVSIAAAIICSEFRRRG
jgi:TrmH family RNA methyltransferase